VCIPKTLKNTGNTDEALEKNIMATRQIATGIIPTLRRMLGTAINGERTKAGDDFSIGKMGS
jgi:hypothetical protein